MEDEIKERNRKRAEIWALKSFRDRSTKIMEEIKKMNVNGIGAGYPAAGKAKVRQAQDGTQSFDREFMGMASQTPPSFVGKVWTKEELMQSVDKQVQSNQSKKMSEIGRAHV